MAPKICVLDYIYRYRKEKRDIILNSRLSTWENCPLSFPNIWGNFCLSKCWGGSKYGVLWVEGKNIAKIFYKAQKSLLKQRNYLAKNIDSAKMENPCWEYSMRCLIIGNCCMTQLPCLSGIFFCNRLNGLYFHFLFYFPLVHHYLVKGTSWHHSEGSPWSCCGANCLSTVCSRVMGIELLCEQLPNGLKLTE